MRKLYKYELDCGRMGVVDGLFIADEDEVNEAMGKYVYFGEILGKHSDIGCDLQESQLTVKSDDPGFVERLEAVIGSETISGYNPLDNLEEGDKNE